MAYIYDLSDTWNAAGTTFFGIKMNVTNSASASGSKLLSLQVAGTEYFGVDKDGNVTIGNGGDLSISSATGGDDTVIYNDAENFFVAVNGTPQLHISSAGNFGVGNMSPGTKFDVAGNIRLSGANPVIELNNGGSQIYSTTANTLQFATGGGIGGAIERMRIDSNGNVAIGTTSTSAGYGSGKSLMLSNQSGLLFLNASSAWNSTTSGGGVTYFSDNALYLDAKDSSSAIIFRVNGATERARINSSGKVLIGSSSATAADVNGLLQSHSEIVSKGSVAGFFWENRSGGVTSNSNWYGWYTSGGTIFLYNGSANIASINSSTGAYTALSDAAHKKDFEVSGIGLDAILALKPTLFRMTTDDEDAPKQLGFIAQEVKDHIPQAYVEQKNTDASGNDTTYIGLNDRPIIAALVKAVQELTARVAELEGK